MDNWFGMHEYWNNTAVIEEIEEGVANYTCERIKQWWYRSDDMTKKKPVPIERPVCTEINKGQATMMAL